MGFPGSKILALWKENISKILSRSVTCKLELKISLTRVFYENFHNSRAVSRTVRGFLHFWWHIFRGLQIGGSIFVTICLCRAMLCKRGLCHHAVSVHLCVCVRVSVMLVSCVRTSNRIVRVFHSRVDTPFYFSAPNGMAIFLRVPSQRGHRMQVGWVEIAIPSLYLAWLPMLRLQQAGVVNTFAGGPRPPSRKLWHIAGSKRRLWLQEETTKCLWQ